MKPFPGQKSAKDREKNGMQIAHTKMFIFWNTAPIPVGELEAAGVNRDLAGSYRDTCCVLCNTRTDEVNASTVLLSLKEERGESKREGGGNVNDKEGRDGEGEGEKGHREGQRRETNEASPSNSPTNSSSSSNCSDDGDVSAPSRSVSELAAKALGGRACLTDETTRPNLSIQQNSAEGSGMTDGQRPFSTTQESGGGAPESGSVIQRPSLDSALGHGGVPIVMSSNAGRRSSVMGFEIRRKDPGVSTPVPTGPVGASKKRRGSWGQLTSLFNFSPKRETSDNGNPGSPPPTQTANTNRLPLPPRRSSSGGLPATDRTTNSLDALAVGVHECEGHSERPKGPADGNPNPAAGRRRNSAIGIESTGQGGSLFLGPLPGFVEASSGREEPDGMPILDSPHSREGTCIEEQDCSPNNNESLKPPVDKDEMEKWIRWWDRCLLPRMPPSLRKNGAAKAGPKGVGLSVTGPTGAASDGLTPTSHQNQNSSSGDRKTRDHPDFPSGDFFQPKKGGHPEMREAAKTRRARQRTSTAGLPQRASFAQGTQ
uniref:Uncharacterized protein n=1 Tax=Chromera velia CCMP2878 TaxID=1169474 RepID=A0A0G4F9J9_9ALVE|eukprot:Cvel_15914.t1-p1 / transcript=Cvel_15914.t1 / gene=Cvel_15914 / organism=Chromera_velia_CCMP2878 / gene_product=hypothetical protein / transcript_product=hypothetical protein / location=Cvel_scaffold1203:16264-19037(-) / protein_length=541 / sequence_SO=supercontig / SO=protein_coding / is_pseudo=false